MADHPGHNLLALNLHASCVGSMVRLRFAQRYPATAFLVAPCFKRFEFDEQAILKRRAPAFERFDFLLNFDHLFGVLDAARVEPFVLGFQFCDQRLNLTFGRPGDLFGFGARRADDCKLFTRVEQRRSAPRMLIDFKYPPTDRVDVAVQLLQMVKRCGDGHDRIVASTRIKPAIMRPMRPRSGESDRGSVIDFALILILFSIVLVVIVVLLGPRIADFLGSLVRAR